MKIDEIIKANKPKSPEQMRVDVLKRQADQATAAANAEVQRQRLGKATRRLAGLRARGQKQ